MTRKAWKACAAPGCPVLVRGARRCSAHERQLDQARGTSGQRGYDWRWQAFRDDHIGDRCEKCGISAADSPWPLELHHLDGLGPNGPRGRDPTNLQTLCKPDHTIQTLRRPH